MMTDLITNGFGFNVVLKSVKIVICPHTAVRITINKNFAIFIRVVCRTGDTQSYGRVWNLTVETPPLLLV